MPIERKEIEDIKTEIAVLNVSLNTLNNSLSSVTSLVNKLDDTITKVYTLDSSIKVLEQKIDTSNTDANLRRRESENSVREIKQQMHDMQYANETSLNDKMDRIFAEIKDLRSETKLSFKEVFDDLKEQKTRTENSLRELEGRVTKLENWRWWVMGVGLAVTTVASFVWKTFFG